MKRLSGRLILHGHKHVKDGGEQITLRDVSITADAKLLKKLGKFLIECSKKLDEQDHFHFSGYCGDTDIVVVAPQES